MRFYFDISDRLPSPTSELSWGLRLASEAVTYAILAAGPRPIEPDIRPRLSIRVIGEGLEPIHEEAVPSLKPAR